MSARLKGRAFFTCAALALALGEACTDRDIPVGAGPVTDPPVVVAISSGGAGPGGRIAVALDVADSTLVGLQGTLRFDPSRLLYAGQEGPRGTLVMVGDGAAEQGLIKVLSLKVDGLPRRSAVLVFQVLAAGYGIGLRYDGELAATHDLRVQTPGTSWVVRIAPDLVVPAAPRRLTLADWYEILAPGLAARERPGPQAVPGEYRANLRYGDANLSGGINVLDAAFVANLVVGNQPLLTDAGKDYVIAGNVHPANLPGLGEDGDAAPPGQDPSGGFTLTVLDAAVIANEAVGNNQPVAGEFIPGREPRPTARVALHGVLPADRTLFRDTIYQLDSLVIVPGGVTLTIQAGTTIEGDAASAARLAIYRGGRLVAAGTRLQPIVFTCTATVKARGCWGGLVINGWSLINNGDGTQVCPQKNYPTTPGFGGGCLVEDSSGVLRYVRIEYAGAAPPNQAPIAGLSLLGVGSHTHVDSVQVFQSLGDGLFVGGGTVDLRDLVLSDNAGDGLHWEDGWVGRAQFMIVQQSAVGRHALHGINFAPDPNAGPRSNPSIYHVTISGPPGGAGATGDGVRLEHGSALTLGDAIVLRAGVAGLDIDGAESCGQAFGMPGIHVSGSLFFANPEDFSSDADCVDEVAYATAPVLGNRMADPLLVAPFNTLTPDLRPSAGSPVTTGFVVPPANGFFDTTPMYVGAVAPANGTGTNIPWYAGWTRGW